MEESDGTASSSSIEEEDEKDDVPVPEPLAPNRLRRANAGAKMRELMNSAAGADDFYESAYGGGFKEDDAEDFTLVENSEGEEDEVDSDFDRSEDEAADDNDNAALAAGAAEDAALQKAERQRMLAKNRRWAVARFNKCTVRENICDARTQRERLAEAKHTEQLNIASLRRFEEVELERRKRHMKHVAKQGPVGPVISLISRGNGKRVLIVPSLEEFPHPAKRTHQVCAVTGRIARYMDPLTGLAYANAAAFRIIREAYEAYVRGTQNNITSSMTTAADTGPSNEL